MDQLASLLKAKCHLPDGKPITLKAIYFSHVKSSLTRAVRVKTVALEEDLSQTSKVQLRLLGLPPVTPATVDRIGSAYKTLMWNRH